MHVVMHNFRCLIILHVHIQFLFLAMPSSSGALGSLTSVDTKVREAVVFTYAVPVYSAYQAVHEITDLYSCYVLWCWYRAREHLLMSKRELEGKGM